MFRSEERKGGREKTHEGGGEKRGQKRKGITGETQTWLAGDKS